MSNLHNEENSSRLGHSCYFQRKLYWEFSSNKTPLNFFRGPTERHKRKLFPNVRSKDLFQATAISVKQMLRWTLIDERTYP